MRITFTPSAWDDYIWFQENDRKLVKRINLLIRDCTRATFNGIGLNHSKESWPVIGRGGLLANIA